MQLHPLTVLWLLVFLASGLTPAAAQTSGDIVVGDMTLHISDSWTAQVFHITDQLSDWSPYSHHQYIRWAKKSLRLTTEDSAVLSRYAAVRKGHRNSDDFDHSFLVDGSIEQATAAAVAQRRLSPDEGKQVQGCLLYFASRLALLRDTAKAQVNAFYRRYAVHRAAMDSFLQHILYFTESQDKITIPVFLVVNPEDGSGGGEANGGRLVIELQQHPDPLPFVAHESFHLLLVPHLVTLKALADSANVDWQVINEGMAYALEGLLEDPDLLPGFLVQFIAAGRTIADPYVKFYMAAIVFRPMMRKALADGKTISTFIPEVIAKWKTLGIR
jgi:hypothetical protein